MCFNLIVRIRTSYMHACTHTYIVNVKNYIPESRGSRAFQCFMSVGFAGLEKPFCFWLENALSRTTSFCLKVPVYRSKEAQPYPTMSDVRLVLQVHFRSFSGCSCDSVAFEPRWTARREEAAKSKASNWDTAPAVGVDSSGSLHVWLRSGCKLRAHLKEHVCWDGKGSFAYLCILHDSFIHVHICASFQVLQSTGSLLVNSQPFFLDLVLVMWHSKIAGFATICHRWRPCRVLSYLICLQVLQSCRAHVGRIEIFCVFET